MWKIVVLISRSLVARKQTRRIGVTPYPIPRAHSTRTPPTAIPAQQPGIRLQQGQHPAENAGGAKNGPAQPHQRAGGRRGVGAVERARRPGQQFGQPPGQIEQFRTVAPQFPRQALHLELLAEDATNVQPRQRDHIQIGVHHPPDPSNVTSALTISTRSTRKYIR